MTSSTDQSTRPARQGSSSGSMPLPAAIASATRRDGHGNSTLAHTPSPRGARAEVVRQPLGEPALDAASGHRDDLGRERVVGAGTEDRCQPGDQRVGALGPVQVQHHQRPEPAGPPAALGPQPPVVDMRRDPNGSRRLWTAAATWRAGGLASLGGRHGRPAALGRHRGVAGRGGHASAQHPCRGGVLTVAHRRPARGRRLPRPAGRGRRRLPLGARRAGADGRAAAAPAGRGGGAGDVAARRGDCSA